MKKDIVITGLGIVSSAGIGKDSFWNAIKGSTTTIDKINIFNTSDLECKLGGQVQNFNAAQYIPGKGLIYLDRPTIFSLTAARLALDDARYPLKDTYDDRAGICLAILGTINSAYDFHKVKILQGVRAIEPMNFPNTVMNCPASHISIRFKLTGPNLTIASGLSAGLEAVCCGINLIEDNRADIVLCGGVEELCYPTQFALEELGLLSRSGKVAVFDKGHDGYLFSEGACFVAIETEESAIQRGVPIYAHIKGFGRGFQPAYNKPIPEAITLSMKQCLDFSHTSHEAIDLVFSGSNACPDYDMAEAHAIKGIFKDKTSVTAIKSLVGESYSASSAFNIASAALSLREGFVPKIANFNEPFDGCSLNIVRESESRSLENVLVSAFGCYGHSVSVVLSKK